MRRTAAAFVKVVGKAFLNAVSFGIAGEVVFEIGPAFLQDIQEGLAVEVPAPADQRDGIEGVLIDPGYDLDIEAIVCEIANGRPEPERNAVRTYLRQIPPSIRQSQKRPDDPSGTSLRPGFSLKRPEDLAVILPSKTTRFAIGHRPAGLDYELVEWLGTGGFGEVWKAKHVFIAGRKPVALKFCTDPEANKWLLREAEMIDRVTREVHHPGVVALSETYLSAEPPCLRFEYVEGGHLAGLIGDWHAGGNRPDPLAVAGAILEIAEIVAFAHALKPDPIVHRDLKPANILVSRDGGKVTFKITDFGIGGIAITQARAVSMKAADAAPSMTVGVRGSFTPNYASPEQMKGGPPDPRDDVHALGVVWHQMMTGDVTEGRPGGIEWLDEFEESGMPRPLVRLMASCFEKANRRPADAGVLVERLRVALAPPVLVVVESPAPPPPFADTLGIRMVLIPAGSFLMGSTEAQIAQFRKRYPDTKGDMSDDEHPQHLVNITRPFFMAAHQVTVAQFRRFVEDANYQTEGERDGKGGYGWEDGEATWERDPRHTWKNPGFAQGDDHPVVLVSWNDAMSFCEWLSAKDGRAFGLPTEAQWEYACRAGSTTLFPNGDDPERLFDIANVAETSFKGKYPRYAESKADDGYVHTTPVGKFAAKWGLHDMIGNVSEWCADAHKTKYYATSPTDDPPGPPASKESDRVLRGGGWDHLGRFCRSAYRGSCSPSFRNYFLGFRLAAVQSEG